MVLLHRLSAILLCVGLFAGNGAVCAGWAASPGARMACCAEGVECPMHKHHSGDSGSTRLVTQTQADACCAASEHEQSNPSDPMKVTTISPAVLGAGVVTPSITPALVLTDGWRTAESTHSPPVPRHLLFSVFLV